MAYSKTTWVDDTTPLSATNMNKIENELVALDSNYGTSSTAAATAAKVVTLSGFTLSAKTIFGVTFTNVNTAAAPTLAVNSTAATAVYVGASAATSSQIPKVAYFQYDGTYYQLLNPVGTNTYSGSYTGTGTYGSGNKNSLTLGFAPKLLIVGTLSSPSLTILIYNSTSAWNMGFNVSLTVAWSSNTVTWYNDSSAGNQLNSGSTTYYYTAIG